MAKLKFNAVIFDMDGTLIDTERHYIDAWRVAAADQGFDLTKQIAASLLGRPTADCIADLKGHFGPDFDTAHFQKTYRPLIEERFEQHVPLMPGAQDMLDRLSAAGVPLAVATSATRPSAEHYLSTAGIHARFQTIVTRNDVTHGKPHGEPFEKAARALGIAPQRCLAFEDTEAGIHSAHAAGTVPIMVPSMKQPSAHVAGKCHAVCASLTEAAALIF